MIRLTRYQWTVLLAAWLGWGFDVFDGLLFNYVAPNCVPTLLGLEIGSPEAKQATLFWTGLLTSVLLLGWAAGGILFGMVADRIGRTRTLMLTMLLYALGTAACAAAPSIAFLVAFRLIASLGIGGEWAAGASMVAEVVPEEQRVEAGALLYTAAPLGLFLATFVNHQVAAVWMAESPETSWRVVFLFGLVPAAVAFLVRMFVREPERWKAVKQRAPAPTLRDVFAPGVVGVTIRGTLMAIVALISWWSCNAFIPAVSSGLAQAAAQAAGLERSATLALVESWKTQAMAWFNLGGLIGTLLTIPIAKHLGRKPMFAIYFALSAAAIYAAFGLDWPPETRLHLYFFIGLSVFGIFGSFTFYLPELFPTRLRGTGSGFCYNVGRIVAAAGPFAVGAVAARGVDHALEAISLVALVPLAGLLFVPFIVETRGRVLAD
ncbi:MAG TPA: MFS transporter [Steroidobacteraceae bacterium]|nr:MFS transporter [Steroidobacteraceae bacterium]